MGMEIRKAVICLVIFAGSLWALVELRYAAKGGLVSAPIGIIALLALILLSVVSIVIFVRTVLHIGDGAVPAVRNGQKVLHYTIGARMIFGACGAALLAVGVGLAGGFIGPTLSDAFPLFLVGCIIAIAGLRDVLSVFRYVVVYDDDVIWHRSRLALFGSCNRWEYLEQIKQSEMGWNFHFSGNSKAYVLDWIVGLNDLIEHAQTVLDRRAHGKGQ